MLGDAFYVVDLGVGLHCNLPVTVEYKRVSRRQSNLIKLEFCPFIGDRTQIFEQADTVFIEVHKDEITETFTANRDQAAAGKIQVGEVFRVPNRYQLTLVGIGPAMILAAKSCLAA